MLASYESWSRVVGGILRIGGIPGFLTNLGDLYAAADAETAALEAFIADWWTEWGSRRVGARELAEAMQLHIDLETGTQRGIRTRAGQKLRALRGRVICGYRIVSHGTNQGAAQYSLEADEVGEDREPAGLDTPREGVVTGEQGSTPSPNQGPQEVHKVHRVHTLQRDSRATGSSDRDDFDDLAAAPSEAVAFFHPS